MSNPSLTSIILPAEQLQKAGLGNVISSHLKRETIDSPPLLAQNMYSDESKQTAKIEEEKPSREEGNTSQRSSSVERSVVEKGTKGTNLGLGVGTAVGS